MIQPDVKPEGHEEDNLAEGITKHTAKKVPKGHLITSGSRFLSSVKNNYVVIELELTAIQWAVDNCRMYLAGTEFTAIHCIHLHLQYISTTTLEMYASSASGVRLQDVVHYISSTSISHSADVL